MASSIKSHIVDITSCAICLEKLNVPKYLPCLHTFCESCLHTYISAGIEKEKKQSIECPVCRTSVLAPIMNCSSEEWVRGLPLNFLIVGLLEKEKVQNPQKQCMVCQRMEVKSDASFVCIDCSDLLCPSCIKHHTASKLLCDHEIRPVEEVVSDLKSLKTFKNKCTEHKSKELELFCNDHETPCCSMCVSINHRKCEKVIAIEDAAAKFLASNKADDLRNELKKVDCDVKAIISNLDVQGGKFQSQFKDKQRELDESFNNLVTMIYNLKDKRTSEMLKHYNEAKEAVDFLKLGFQNFDKKIENEQQLLATCVTEASQTQIMLEVIKVNKNLGGHKSLIASQSAAIKEYTLSFNNKSDISKHLEKAFEVIFEHSKSNITLSCNTCILAVNRFGIIQSHWQSKGVDAICFCVSKDIQLHGFLSYGCKDGQSICKVTATLKENTNDIIVVSKNLDSKEAECGLLKIMFPGPVKLSNNTKYHVVVDMEGQEYQYGVQGKSTITQNGIVFNFEKSQYSKFPSDTTQGLVPGLLFSVT
ncbi:E3 ubiquitin-protein ligase TRIM63-like [Mytilus trossulus]|uniref:E3 ubiquitin-protein ligase TRIM63-like n=1 Tax=Mytilus trossulus TaxID=6551 RepID=UPI003006AC78